MWIGLGTVGQTDTFDISRKVHFTDARHSDITQADSTVRPLASSHHFHVPISTVFLAIVLTIFNTRGHTGRTAGWGLCGKYSIPHVRETSQEPWVRVVSVVFGHVFVVA